MNIKRLRENLLLRDFPLLLGLLLQGSTIPLSVLLTFCVTFAQTTLKLSKLAQA